MKILVLEGSPNKKGSTHLLADCFQQGAQEAGHTVQMLDIAHAKIHPCTGCIHCGYQGPCVQKDDMAAWLAGKDWSGKLVFPFYSHCGGAVGNIRSDIAALCPGANVRDALGILQVGPTHLPQEIQRWLEAAGIPQQVPAALTI